MTQQAVFDSHCHLDFDAFDVDRAALLQRARAADVTAILVPGVSPEQWPRAAAMRSLGVGIGSGVGIHPWWLERLSATARDAALADLAAAAVRYGAEAIGECGLDGPLAKRTDVGMALQIAVLERHLSVARALALPVVLHVMGAHGPALETLRRHGVVTAGGVLHSYSGSPELVAQYAALGWSFSFAAAVTRANARRPLERARAVPAARLLLESDGPDQPLSGARRSGPEDLARICAAVALARGEDVADIAALTAANAARLFVR
jgi:TatD DNase family protein